MKALISAHVPRAAARLTASFAVALFIVRLMAIPAGAAAADKAAAGRPASAPDSPFFESGAPATDAEG